MVRKISSCSISLLLCLLLSAPLWAQGMGNAPSDENRASGQSQDKPAGDAPEYPLFNGLSVGVDLWGIGGKILGSDFLSAEVSVDANLKHRYFPIVELGWGSTDKWSDHGTRYRTSAPYFRIGMDYNALYNKRHGHMLMVGLRYAATSFKYDIDALGINDPIYGGIVGNPELEDEIWGGSLPYSHQGLKGSMQWLEICVGVRANVCKNLYMGWQLRFRNKLSASTAEYGNPWYVPGYGKYKNSGLGVSYSIIYKLPF